MTTGGPVALVEEMEAFAVKVKKRALRRNGFFNPPGGGDGESGKSAKDEQNRQQNKQQGRHACRPVRRAGRLTT